MKRYAIICYEALYETLEIHLIETDIEKGTEDFEQLIEQFDSNHMNMMIVDADKFLDTIKMMDLTEFKTMTKKDLA